jgi:capsid protein
LAVLLLDPSKTNFSGWRGAMNQAQIGFRNLQRLMIRRFHTPIYLLKVRQWMADDRALRPTNGVKLFRHAFTPPTWPYIEPLKDAGADLLRMRNALTSPRRLHASRSLDWDRVSTEIVEDNALAIRKAKNEAEKVNAEFADGNPVHWRELISLPTPDGVKIQLNAADPGDNSESDDESP